MMRMLVCILAVSSSLTLFAGTARGDRLLQEAGGAIGIAGFAGPGGAPGLAGAAGALGIQGIIGIPGAPGLLDFSDFFTLQSTTVTQNTTITAGNAVQFANIGSTTGTIVPTSPSTFLLPTVGTYLVQFEVGVTEGTSQLQLSLNTVPLSETVVGRASGTAQIVGTFLVTTTSANSVLSVINPEGNGPINLEPIGGSGTESLSSHLVIIRIQ